MTPKAGDHLRTMWTLRSTQCCAASSKLALLATWGQSRRRAIISNDSGLPGDLPPPTCYGAPVMGSRGKFHSLVAQLNVRRALGGLLLKEEARRGKRFDWVVMARPD